MDRQMTTASYAQSQLQQGERTPELETLGSDLHGIASNLAVSVDQLSAKLSRFLNEPHPFANAPTSTKDQAPEPTPGTLGSLHMAQNRLREQQERVAMLVDKVKGIL